MKSDEITEYGVDEYYNFNNNNNMKNGLLKLDLSNVRSALVYGLIAAILYAISVGDLWALNWHTLLNGFVFGALTSAVKNLGTTNSGNFLGVVNTVSQ